jgi:putative Mn2+ efflux pump MntP
MEYIGWWISIFLVAVLWWMAGLAFAILGGIGLTIVALLIQIEENQRRLRQREG